MRRREFVAGLGTAAAVRATPLGFAQSLPWAQKPEIKVGDASVFRDRNVRSGETSETRYRVISVDAATIVTETIMTKTAGASYGTRTFTREWNLLQSRTDDGGMLTVRPYWPRLRFPLEVGETWEATFEVEISNLQFRRNAKWRWKAQVARAEMVTVPAGTFRALVIASEGTFDARQEWLGDGRGARSWDGTHKETDWYAPEVMRLAKWEFEQSAPANNFFDHHVMELLSFTRAQ